MLRRFLQPIAPSLAVVLLLCSVAGCGEEHSRLATDEDAGVGGQATTATGSAGSTHSGGSAGSGGAGGDPEPSGPTKVTVVNGVVDDDAVRICWLPYPSGDGSEPWPGETGLGFARAGRIDPITPTVPLGVDVQVFVVGGDLALTAGLSCAEVLNLGSPADAGAAVRIESAGVLPAGVFESGRSLIIALHGCLGAADHDHPSAGQICGADYAAPAANLGMAVGFLSRLTSPDRVGMQFVHASAATPPSYLRIAPGVEGAVTEMAVSSWSLGAISPYPPWWRYSRSLLGTVSEATLELSVDASTPDHQASFAEALANSELEASDLDDGLGFAFVMVGAAPTAPAEADAWWHSLSYTVVPADP